MKNILVFPCGSEIGLEIYRSMKFSRHFHLVGGSSVDDHGRFVFEDYIGDIPFYNDPTFIQMLACIVKNNKIDAIYPAMDVVAVAIKQNEQKLGCRVIGSSAETTAICASKAATYTRLGDHVPVPEWCISIDDVQTYPAFIKPDVGYGSRNVLFSPDRESAQEFVSAETSVEKFIYCEYLPGAEYTVDCFTNRHGELMFVGGRVRSRITNGISTNTKLASRFDGIFQDYAEKINKKLKPRGAWFFQMKQDKNGSLKLLEMAARLGGSSALFRSKGINFALLTTFDAFDIDISILNNSYETELDRALMNKYSINIEYHTVYVDYDDCLLVDSQINTELIAFIFTAINDGKRIILITRHNGDIRQSLKKHRINDLFDEVIHLTDKDDTKAKYITPDGAIFIDDSHAERVDVLAAHHIPVFSPDMVEALI